MTTSTTVQHKVTLSNNANGNGLLDEPHIGTDDFITANQSDPLLKETQYQTEYGSGELEEDGFDPQEDFDNTVPSNEQEWLAESDNSFTELSNVCDDGYQDGLGSTFNHTKLATTLYDGPLTYLRARNFRNFSRGTAKDAVTARPDEYSKLSPIAQYNDPDNQRHYKDKYNRVREIAERLNCGPYISDIQKIVDEVDFDHMRTYGTIPIAAVCVASILTDESRRHKRSEIGFYSEKELYDKYTATDDGEPKPVEEMTEFARILIENGALNDRLEYDTRDDNDVPKYKRYKGNTVGERLLIGKLSDLTEAQQKKIDDEICFSANDLRPLPDFIVPEVGSRETFYVNMDNFATAKNIIKKKCAVDLT